MFARSLILLLMVAPNLVQANMEQLSEKVIELRKEVEFLNDEYKTEREKVLNDMKALSIQKAELSANIRNEEIRGEQLEKKMTQFKKEIEQGSVESESLIPILQTTIENLKKHIQSSLPFKLKERLDSVLALKERLEKKEISATKAANQLWSMIEDEKRLSRETSLHKQTIPLNEKSHLAEVAKVGMMFLYFKTESGQVGMVNKQGKNWSYQVFTDDKKKQQTLVFFESLKKQIRQGYFEVPTRI